MSDNSMSEYKGSEYQVLARRYRPKTFQEVLGQDPIIQTLKNGLKSGRLSSAYLFCGSRGTGKTTLARILAKALMCENRSDTGEPCNTCSHCKAIANGSSLDIMEIDGASHRGIDDIRIITESAGYAPSAGKYKVYIIDEVHMLTKEAFNALLKTLEEPPKQVKFFFATTEPHKIPETILSRCQRFNLRRIPLELIVQKLKRIAEEAQVSVSNDALFNLAQYAEGGLRDAESMFDLLMAYSTSIDMETVENALGVFPRKRLFDFDSAYEKQHYAAVFEITGELFNQGKDVSYFLKDLIHHYRHILYCQLACFDELRHEDSAYIEAVKASSALYSKDECLAILDILTGSEQGIKTSISQRIFLEATLLKIMRMRSLISIDRIAMRLAQLEQAIRQPSAATPQPLPPPAKQKEEAPQEPALSPKREILATLKDATPKAETPKPKPPAAAPAQQKKNMPANTTQSQFDTAMQFAAVELQGSLEKKQSQDK